MTSPLTDVQLAEMAAAYRCGVPEGYVHGDVLLLLAEVERLQRLLCDLTPGGSEFAGSPDRCAAWVKREIGSYLQTAVTANAERNQMAVEVERLQDRAEKAETNFARSQNQEFLQLAFQEIEALRQERDWLLVLFAYLASIAGKGAYVDILDVWTVLGIDTEVYKEISATAKRGRALVEEAGRMKDDSAN